jgi:hypothetical protein
LNATSGEAMETSSYTYTRQMTKPSITEMTNRTAINAGFTEQWTTGYLITQEFVDAIKECFTPIGSDDMVR